MPDGKNGLNLPFRAESLLSFAEYVKVNRGQDDDASDDPARAGRHGPHLGGPGHPRHGL